MTREQAVAELTRLCDVYERKPSDLRPHQLREWLQTLQDLPYERGRAAVTHLVRTWPSNRFPTPGALYRAAQEVSLEGRPGAMAYYTGPQRSYQEHMARARAALEWQDRLVEMSDEEYHEYLTRLARKSGLRREAV